MCENQIIPINGICNAATVQCHKNEFLNEDGMCEVGKVENCANYDASGAC